MTQQAIPRAGAHACPNDPGGGARDSFEQEDSGIIQVPQQAITRPLVPPNRSNELHTGFVEQQRLADMLFRRRVRRVGPGLVECDGRRFTIQEAVKVTGRSDGHSDPYGLTGLVESLCELVRAGAWFNGETMTLGSATYKVVRGVIAVAKEMGESPPTLSELA